MAQAEFSYSGEAHLLPRRRALVRGTRTSAGVRGKKLVFIGVECLPEEAGAVQSALAVIVMDASTQSPSSVMTVRVIDIETGPGVSSTAGSGH
jgi:hypothetical protein